MVKEKMLPIFSIITPVYNGQEYIRETIDSVLTFASSYRFEYIIVDDGSTDETPSILDDYAGRIRVIRQANSGESNAVNAGLKEASGEIVLIVSDDDPLFTDILFQGVEEFFYSSPDLVCLYSDWQIIDQFGCVIETKHVPEYSDQELIGNNKVLPGPGSFFRRSAAMEIGGRNSKRIFTGDYDFWLRLSRKGKFKRRPEILAQWRNHPDSTSISQRGALMAQERIEVIRDFISSNEIEGTLARNAVANSYYMAARLCFFDKSVAGKRFLLKSLAIERGLPSLFKFHEALFIAFSPFSNSMLILFRKITGWRTQ